MYIFMGVVEPPKGSWGPLRRWWMAHKDTHELRKNVPDLPQRRREDRAQDCRCCHDDYRLAGWLLIAASGARFPTVWRHPFIIHVWHQAPSSVWRPILRYTVVIAGR